MNNEIQQPASLVGSYDGYNDTGSPEVKKSVRKFEDLIASAEELNKVKRDLIKLKSLIGIDEYKQTPSTQVPCPPAPMKPKATLFSTLNDLPREIRGDVDLILKMIAEIHEALN